MILILILLGICVLIATTFAVKFFQIKNRFRSIVDVEDEH